MSLTLYYHPLASACWKVQVALYENGAAFTPRLIDLSQQADRDLMANLTPIGKMPALGDDASGEVVAETSVIVEWLDRHHPGVTPLIPAETDLTVRLWDRFFDFYLHDPMQRIVTGHLFLSPATAAEIAAEARGQLDRAYAALERQMTRRTWVAADSFTLADCAAAPALFYAGVLHPHGAYPAVTAYGERLFARPSVARVLQEAKPYFHMFPFADQLPDRFR